MIRFTSYNVLSSHLSEASSHTGSNPAQLEPAYRFELIKTRMEREIQSDSIIALQEVSHQWAGLHDTTVHVVCRTLVMNESIHCKGSCTRSSHPGDTTS